MVEQHKEEENVLVITDQGEESSISTAMNT
jgi:hypothetical protein